MTCPKCWTDGPIDLGIFGNVHYYRCRHCGWGWGEWVEEEVLS